MSSLDEGVPAWWDRLDDEQRSRIQLAAKAKILDDNGRAALTDTSCPMRPTTVKHDDTEGWVWQEPLREYVLLQEWWDRLVKSDKQIARGSLDTGYELEPEMIEMFTRTRCPVWLDMQGYPPDPNWIVSLPDSFRELISSKFGF